MRTRPTSIVRRLSTIPRLLAAASLVAASLAPLPAPGQQAATIEMFRRAFLPTGVTVEAGGEVTWVWRQGEHIVTSGRSSAPEDNPGALFEARVDESTPSFTYRFDTPGTYPFFDALNEQSGGTGTVTVLSDARTFRVGVVDNAFIPEDIAIFEGDTIHWEHEPNEAFHTVTSGLSSRPEDDPGALFDAPSDDDRPNFFYTFEEPDLYPYFCRPHEHLDMVGTVLVQKKFTRGDFNLDGAADLTDAVGILGHLFLGDPGSGCDDAADVDDSAVVEITDAIALLSHLFLGTFEVPKPYPAPGPDRTDDELRCAPFNS